MLVGGVVFLICGALVIAPLQRYAGAIAALISDPGAPAASEVFARGMALVLEFLPVAVIAFLGGFKANELSAMILSGGGVPGSGIGQRMTQAASVGAAVATGGVTAAGMAVSAARGTMSAMTRGRGGPGGG